MTVSNDIDHHRHKLAAFRGNRQCICAARRTLIALPSMCRTYKLILIALNTVALVITLAILGCSRTMRESYKPNLYLDSASENLRDVTRLRAVVALNNGQINLLEESAVASNLLAEKFLLFYGGVAMMNLVIFGLSQRCQSK